MATYLPAKDVLNVEVSCFANYDTPYNPRPIKMLSWLTSAKYQARVEAIRKTNEKSERDAQKATLPAITPSGMFSYRRAADLIQHSGLIQFDIDQKDNPHVQNYAELKLQLAKLPFVAYCGLSVSGSGYWGLVPIAYPDRHSQHFDALKRVFAHYNIILDDKPRNIASLRGYAYDTAGYFADQVMVFELHDQPAPPPIQRPSYYFGDSDDTGSILINKLARMLESAGEGNRHETLLKAARLAGGYIAAGRIDEQDAVCALETVVGEWPMFAKSQKTIRDGIQHGLLAPIHPTQPPYERVSPLVSPPKSLDSIPGKTGKSTPFSPIGIQSSEQNLDGIPAMDRVRPECSAALVAEVFPGPAKLPALIEHYWQLFERPPLWWNKIATHRTLLRCLEPLVVSTIDEQLACPGSLLKPDESQIERLATPVPKNYPADWDKPVPLGAVPLIKPMTYHEWQRQHPSFKQLGLGSLPNLIS